MNHTIYTDGGCSGNKRGADCKGAWAYLILDCGNNIVSKRSGMCLNTTNNRMEMTAVIEGLITLSCFGEPNMNDCTVITDSNYIVNNYYEYLPDWKKNGWRKGSGGIVLNIDLWKKICTLSPVFKSFKLQWVKGHSTNKFNQAADALVRDLLY